MFNFTELLIIGIIALVFIGPKELPEVARVIGRFLNELKRATSELQSNLTKPQEKLREEMNKLMAPIPPPEFGHKDEPPLEFGHKEEPQPELAKNTANEKPKSEDGQ